MAGRTARRTFLPYGARRVNGKLTQATVRKAHKLLEGDS